MWSLLQWYVHFVLIAQALVQILSSTCESDENGFSCTNKPCLKQPPMVTKQQHMHYTEGPKLQQDGTTWSQNCVFQEEPDAFMVGTGAFVIAPGPAQETQCLQLW